MFWRTVITAVLRTSTAAAPNGHTYWQSVTRGCCSTSALSLLTSSLVHAPVRLSASFRYPQGEELTQEEHPILGGLSPTDLVLLSCGKMVHESNMFRTIYPLDIVFYDAFTQPNSLSGKRLLAMDPLSTHNGIMSDPFTSIMPLVEPTEEKLEITDSDQVEHRRVRCSSVIKKRKKKMNKHKYRKWRKKMRFLRQRLGK